MDSEIDRWISVASAVFAGAVLYFCGKGELSRKAAFNLFVDLHSNPHSDHEL